MINFLDLKKINKPYRSEIDSAVKRVIDSGWYIRGKEVTSFEKEFSEFIGVKHTVGVGNGLDALKIILKAYLELGYLKKGDEVIVPAHTYIASILAITNNGLKPVLVEPNVRTYNIDPDLIEAHITERTKAVMIVHLYGQNAYDQKIKKLCKKYNLKLIEDAAQAHGAYYKNRRIGSLGDAAAFSFYPGKNLGAMGDAGAICSDDGTLIECCRALGNYGSQKKYYNKYQGYNSRLDEVQAAVLRIKLKGLDDDNEKRRAVAEFYLGNIDNPNITLPDVKQWYGHVWHLFVVRVTKRAKFLQYLSDNKVETLIHYPVPPNKQKGYPCLHHFDLPITEKLHKQVVSLPISPVLSQENIKKVSSVVSSYA